MCVATKARKILIVEDNPDMREAYQVFFSDQQDKYAVAIAEDAMEGSRQLNEQVFDLVILDIIMEPVSGDSLALYLRSGKNEVNNGPVLVISVLSWDRLEDIHHLPRLYYLQKPIAEDQLLKKIDEILG